VYPGKYNTALSWTVPAINFGKSSKRKPLLNDPNAAERPSVHSYKLEKIFKIKFALDKSEGKSYISEAQFRGSKVPGPNYYTLN